MAAKDNRIDIYITKSEDFAKPVLSHIRQLVHKACPNVEETIKWGFPHFDYYGSTLCSMASFKQHCAFGFWKAALMPDPKNIFSQLDEPAMGHLGRIKSLKDLPSDKILIKYIKEAARLNKEGIKIQKSKPVEKKELKVPDYLIRVLKKNKKAEETFNNFSYTNKKEYIEWFAEAKTEETRNRRLVTAIEWISEGKSRNWKYMKK